ncbi:hypothetical protein ABPG72_008044 [Tetrahymena utriculariae]
MLYFQNHLIKTLFFVYLLANQSFSQEDKQCQPRQVRLLIGDDYTHYKNPIQIQNTATIIFQTYDQCIHSHIKVFIKKNETLYQGSEGKREIVHSKWNGEQFCHNGKKCSKLYYDQYTHIFRLPIMMGVEFSYVVFGDTDSKSRVFKSKLPDLIQEECNMQKFLFFGDQDVSAQANTTFQSLMQLKQKGEQSFNERIESFVFLGDYSYEFYQNNGQKGDQYLDVVQDIIAEWPTVFSPGNHEEQYNYKFFNEKFQLPNFKQTQNNYFSFNQGQVHFIGVNLNYFSRWADNQNKLKMLKWIENDLIIANQNRNQTPWIVAFGHKPIHCVQNDDCSMSPFIYRQIDDLFYNYTVDLFLGSHVHYHELLKPMYRGSIQAYEGNLNDIKYPQGMITVIQGNGGQENEFQTDFKQNLKFQDRKNHRSFKVRYQVGYGILEVHDKNRACIKTINSQTSELKDQYCIYSFHRFNRDLLNTEPVDDYVQNKKQKMIWRILLLLLLIIISFIFIYRYLRFREDHKNSNF